jgi:hypothetical protein
MTYMRLVLLCILSGSIIPASEVTLQISSLPLWQTHAVAPELTRGHSLFLDPEAGELVAIVSNSEAEKPVRIPLRSLASAQVSGVVSQTAEGYYAYEYTLQVAARSRRPLSQWSLLLPRGTVRVEAPPFWKAEVAGSPHTDKIVGPNGLFQYVHFAAEPGYELTKSSSLQGFRVVSEAAPGYVTGFLRSPAPPSPSAGTLASLPNELAARVETALWLENDSQMATVLGPRFLKGASLRARLAAFDLAMQHFVSEQRLPEDSRFLRQGLEAIRTYLQAPEAVVVSTGFLGEAVSPVEKELATAIRMSLRAAEGLDAWVAP